MQRSTLRAAIPVCLALTAEAFAQPADLPSPTRPQVQLDLGLSVITANYEHPLPANLAVAIGVGVFSTWFLPVFDAGDRFLGPGAELRITRFFRDDGRGLNLDAIRQRGLSSGLLTAETAPTATPDDLAKLIFAPGFSTAEKVGDHAGRGMGMDIIKSKVVDEAGGVLEVHSTPGQFCEFRIYLPPQAKA